MLSLLELDEISLRYRHKLALSPTSLKCSAGKITGLLGPNGAGKTSLLTIASCSIAPTSGYVRVNGKTVTDAQSARQARQDIGVVMQNPTWIRSFTGVEMTEYAGWLAGVPRRQLHSRALECLELVEMAGDATQRMSSMSGGMRQRVALAMALVGSPSILLLDEPTVGLDPAQRLTFRNVLRSLESTAVLISTHLVEDVRALADEIVMLNQGQCIWRGTTERLEALGSNSANSGASPIESGYMHVLSSSQESQ